MPKVIGVGLIGAGWIGRVHAEQYQRVPQLCSLPDVTIKLQAVSDVIPQLAQKIASDFGFMRCYPDWHTLIEDPEVTLVDICVPNSLHREIAIAAANAGKHLFCEKPMSMSADEGKDMFVAAENAGVRHMVNFNYRRVPAIVFAKQMLENGTLGQIYQFRGGFTQDFAADPQLPWTWRFSQAGAGGGSLVTMGSHVIDCARYLVGDFTSLTGLLNTFISERPSKNNGMVKVDVDDGAAILSRFQSGATGMLHTTWLAQGRKHHFEWEINASRGSLHFNSERLNELEVSESSDPAERQGFKTIYVGEHHPYGQVFGLKSGMGIGIRETFLLQTYELLRGILEDKPVSPSFYDGWQVDRVVQAVTTSSANGQWVQLTGEGVFMN